MMMKSFAVAAAMLIAAGAADAATLSVAGTTVSQVLTKNDIGLNGKTVNYISGDLKNGTNGLTASGAGKITFEYLGYEAGNKNYSADVDGTMFTNGVTAVGTKSSYIQSAMGLLDFLFGTIAPAPAVGKIANNGIATATVGAIKDLAIGFIKIDDYNYYVLFDDIASNDRDFDDLGMKVTISPVPVPAAGLMLVGALGGLAALRRKKAA